MHGDNVEAEVQVLAECAVAICRLQVAIGSCDHTDVHIELFVAADRADFLLLQYAQQFCLHFQRKLANFVQKNRAAVGCLEKVPPWTLIAPVKAPFSYPKSSLSIKRRHQRAAINGDEWSLCQRAAEMNRTRHQFFSRTAFAGNQYRCTRIFQPRDHPQHVLNVRRRAYNAIKIVFGVHALAQKLIFRNQTNFFRHALQ